MSTKSREKRRAREFMAANPGWSYQAALNRIRRAEPISSACQPVAEKLIAAYHSLSDEEKAYLKQLTEPCSSAPTDSETGSTPEPSSLVPSDSEIANK